MKLHPFYFIIVACLWGCQQKDEVEVVDNSPYEDAMVQMFSSSTEKGIQEAFILNLKVQPDFKYGNLKCFISPSEDYAFILDEDKLCLALHQNKLSSSKNIKTTNWNDFLVSVEANSNLDVTTVLEEFSKIRKLKK